MADEDGDGSRAPLEELAESIGRRSTGGAAEWLEDLAGETADRDTEAIWERLRGGGRSDPTAPANDPGGSDRNLTASPGPEGADPILGGIFPSYPSRFVLWAHGITTAGALAGAVAIYLLAVTGTIPEHFWIASLPLLTLGLFGVLPVLAWVIGIWQPRELG